MIETPDPGDGHMWLHPKQDFKPGTGVMRNIAWVPSADQIEEAKAATADTLVGILGDRISEEIKFDVSDGSTEDGHRLLAGVRDDETTVKWSHMIHKVAAKLDSDGGYVVVACADHRERGLNRAERRANARRRT